MSMRYTIVFIWRCLHGNRAYRSKKDNLRIRLVFETMKLKPYRLFHALCDRITVPTPKSAHVCNMSVHKLSTSCLGIACVNLSSLKQAVNNL